MLHYQLQDEQSPSSLSLAGHYRPGSESSFAAQLDAADRDKAGGLEEEEKERRRRQDEDDDEDDGSDTPAAVQRVDLSDSPPPAAHASHAYHLPAHDSRYERERKRDREERDEQERRSSPLPPPATAHRNPSPPHLVHGHQHPLSSSASTINSTFSLRSVTSPPPPRHGHRVAVPISLRNKPARERQQAIHHLLSQSSVVSVSSPEYEFSQESSTHSQPRTPSASRKREEAAAAAAAGGAAGAEVVSDLKFVKEKVEGAGEAGVEGGRPAGGGGAGSGAVVMSSLAKEIQRAHSADGPVLYRRQAGSPRGSQLSSAQQHRGKLKITVFLPVNDLLIQLEVSSSITASSLIRLVLDIYRRENASNLHPGLLHSMRSYQLFIAEEDGNVDTDFPGLDPNAQLASASSTHFSLRPMPAGAAAAHRRQRPRHSPTYSPEPRASISISNISLSEDGHATDEAADRGGGDHGGSMERAGRGGDSRGDASQERSAPAAFGVESGGSEKLVTALPWYARLLCCGGGDEHYAGWADAADRRRKSTTDSTAAAGSSGR